MPIVAAKSEWVGLQGEIGQFWGDQGGQVCGAGGDDGDGPVGRFGTGDQDGQAGNSEQGLNFTKAEQFNGRIGLTSAKKRMF